MALDKAMKGGRVQDFKEVTVTKGLVVRKDGENLYLKISYGDMHAMLKLNGFGAPDSLVTMALLGWAKLQLAQLGGGSGERVCRYTRKTMCFAPECQGPKGTECDHGVYCQHCGGRIEVVLPKSELPE